MNCPKCGAPIEDGAKFCMSCGCNIEASAENQAELVPQVQVISPDSNKPRKLSVGCLIKKAIILIVGTAMILLGAWRFSTAGTTISAMSFGGDFFTYSYQGIVAISEILVEIEKSVGVLIIAIGAAIDVSALHD